MEACRLIFYLSSLLIITSRDCFAATTQAPDTCESKSCRDNEYCLDIAGSAICRICDDGCNGCKGFGPSNCNECQLGYRNASNVCVACAVENFGANCAGTCRCLYTNDDEECNPQTGNCKSLKCALGWSGLPNCQTPCSNKTFGSMCAYQCHCPPNDTCSKINGLCSSNQCAVGWSSAGCQNELPQLSDKPTAENVTCANATVVWLGWRRGIDRGNSNRDIARYELYLSFNTSSGADPQWTSVSNVSHDDSLDEYRVFLPDLNPDAYYVFRVDVRQQDGDKLMRYIMDGKPSDEIFIPCTDTTTTRSTTTPRPATTRAPGPYLLDESKFSVHSFGDTPTILQVDWSVLDDVRNFTINLNLTYFLIKVSGSDCPPVDDPVKTSININESGSLNISSLLPWRQYRINITAVSEEHNLTDSLQKDGVTSEAVPTVPVRSLKVSSVTAISALVSWYIPECVGQNGDLLYYIVDVFEATNLTHAILTYNTNSSFYEVTSLSPYMNYSVSVVYVNSKGAGPRVTELAAFRTLEAAPGPPRIVNVTSDMTSITLTLEEPYASNGIILEYQVSVAENENFQSSLTKSFIKDPDLTLMTVTMTSLQPDTLYYIKASASTSVGTGQATPPRQITTKQSVPKPPANVTADRSFRNETCVKLQWSHADITNGNITGYTVTYGDTSSSHLEPTVVSTNETSLHVCDLVPGKFYGFTIVASNPTGDSEEAIITLSTEQADPPSPPIPEVLNTTSATIGVALDPVVMTSTTYEYGYLLSIDDVTGKNKRAVSTSNVSCPGTEEIPGTIVRNFTQSEIPYRISFLLGDGKQYDAFENKPLTKDHLYDIYYVITSNFENVCKYTYVKTTSPIKAESVVVIEPKTSDDSSTNIGLIIGIVVLAILIIAVIAILIFCWLRNRRSGQNYEPYYNEKDDFDLKVYEKVDDYNAQKYWNTIYSLRESRYIIAGREYLPGGHQFMNGSVGISNGGQQILFHDEFSNLPHGRLATFNFAKRRDNELKNRFSHLLPYDHSRVILDPDTNSDSDYINASFIKGYKHQRAYIAAQSPFDEDTVLDFWRMIYQYQVRVIVMLSNIVEDNIIKCTQYWPDHGRVMYGQFVLDLVDVKEYADYTVRSVRVRTSTDRDWQMVYIFDFTSWPEHGVPDDAIPLLEMRRKINVYQNRNTTPIVVHCGTGVSRSGVYIAVDSLIQQYEQEGRISVYSFVRKMRKDRPAMVRTAKQYTFIYEALFEAMVAGDTFTGPGDLKETYQMLTKKNPANRHSYLHGQFHCLAEFTRKLYPTMCSNAYYPANSGKNRFCEIVPLDQYRPVLTTPGGLGRTDYINAVYLDSHKKSCHYVITQTPLHTTVTDFWKLVYDHDIYTIVMMEPMTFEDDTCAEYWPDDHMKQYEPFFVEATDVYQQENITIRNFKLTSMSSPKDTRHIRQFQFNAWSDTEFIPKSKSMLLDVIDLVNDWQLVNNNDSTPILVHCKDGATHSGLFIAVSLLCEKVMDESEVDVFHTVKHLKRRRTQIVDMLDQYRFCYKALWDFINMRMNGGTLTEQMSKTRADKPYSSLSLASYSSSRDYMPY